MTVKELSQLFWLKKEIERDEARLEELRALARSVSAMDFSAVRVQGGKQESKLELQVVEIVDLEHLIAEKRQRCITEQLKLERYIQSIPDSYLRMIFTMRFIDCMRWLDIAFELEGTTEDAVKKSCYRYLKKNREKKQSCPECPEEFCYNDSVDS